MQLNSKYGTLLRYNPYFCTLYNLTTHDKEREN